MKLVLDLQLADKRGKSPAKENKTDVGMAPGTVMSLYITTTTGVCNTKNQSMFIIIRSMAEWRKNWKMLQYKSELRAK